MVTSTSGGEAGPPKRRTRKLHVGCLEGRWAPELTDRQSVLPVLELLESQDWIRYFHQASSTKEQLLSDLERFTQRRYAGYEVLYLGFHGSPSSLHVGDDEISLAELAEPLAGECSGRIIHLASCATGKNTRKRIRGTLEDFRATTGAKSVTAYTEYTDWTESAAFELLLFSWLAAYGSKKSGWALRRVVRQYPDLVRSLGFITTP